MSLKRKLSEQALELNQLRRFTSPDMSSASEFTPEHSTASGLPRAQFSKDRSPIYPVFREHKQEDIPVRIYIYICCI